jgi:hypothetical protein
MNIQENAQKNIDYYKELKTVKKEIEKIYKLLSKDETLPEMIESIQNDLNKNISYILTNLTKPNSTYKELNPKITKILSLLIALLKNCTSYKDNVVDNENFCIIYFKYEKSFEYNKDLIDMKITQANGDEIKGIIKNILICTYYKGLFEKNQQTDDDIAKLNSLESHIKDPKTPQEERKNYEGQKIELEKEKYRSVLNYIQVSSFEIFDYVDKRYESLIAETTPVEDNGKKGKKEKDEEKQKEAADELITTFKTEIYYTFININNTRSNDPETQQYENGNEKIELDLRKNLLEKLREELDKQLNTLQNIINFLVDSNKQEYSKEITDVKNKFKDYKNEKEYKDNILSLLMNEEGEIKKLLDKNSNERKVLEQKIEIQRAELERDRQERRGIFAVPRTNGGSRGGSRSSGSTKKMLGGERKLNKYYEDKYKPLKILIKSIDNLIDEIAKIEGKESDKDPFSKKNGMFGDSGDDVPSIYKNIWHDYKKEMNKIKSKGVSIDSLKQDDRLYERFKMNELDPQDVLKISFQDKVIFICVVLIIRTFAMVLIELLIEYNFVSTLSRGILVYSVLYILLLFIGVLIINYDSYKLRILVNYLNVHINSSNIFFHVLLFALFIGLILIIINDNEGDNNLKGVDNILNYTYIYKYIYEIAEKSNPASNLLLSQKEKVKLQYRMDIITMIIFIFSSLLILIM